ncbi:MAG: diacylglycerol kinase family lipid kinase [Bacteroidales bacterium]|nr:diacylglycerol kinase family lipid kinase [Bacteroidales bacterium]
MYDSWKVIVNPHAGGGSCKIEWNDIEKLLQTAEIAYTAELTKGRYHAIDIAKSAFKEGYRKFIAVGGDGTIHEIVSGIVLIGEDTRDVTMAVIPVGTGNDWGREWGITIDHKQAIECIVRGNTRVQDLAEVHAMKGGKMNIVTMVNIGGLGFDANVSSNVNDSKDQGKYEKNMYLKTLIKTFLGYSNRQLKIVTNGKVFYDGKVFSTAFGIGKFSGGGMMQTPLARPDDSLLDITVIKKIPKIKVLFQIKKLFSGKILDIKQVIHTQAQSVKVTSWPPSKVEVDGEIVGFTPTSIKLLPLAIRVIVP